MLLTDSQCQQTGGLPRVTVSVWRGSDTVIFPSLLVWLWGEKADLWQRSSTCDCRFHIFQTVRSAVLTHQLQPGVVLRYLAESSPTCLSSDCSSPAVCCRCVSSVLTQSPKTKTEKQRLLSQDCVTNQTFRHSDLWEEDMFFPLSPSLRGGRRAVQDWTLSDVT